MPEIILPKLDAKYESFDGCLATLVNFKYRMTTSQAEAMLGLGTGAIRGAIERGEIEYVSVGKGQKRVTPLALAVWIRDYTTIQPNPLPG